MSTALPRTADVVVVGSGTVGSMALRHLARNPGLRVVGIDRYGPAHGRGSFAGESRLFRMAAKEGELYVPLLTESRAQWLALEREAGRSLFLPTGVLSIGAAGSPELAATIDAARTHSLAHEVWDAEELRDRYPQHAYRPGDVAVFDTGGGALRPELAVLSALDSASSHGAHLVHGCSVREVQPHARGVRVVTSAGSVDAGRVIVSAGSWTPRLLPTLRDTVRVQQIVLAWFMPRTIAEYTADRFPAFIRDMDGIHAFGAPSLDGFSIKVSPGADGLENVADVSDLPSALCDEYLDALGRDVSRLLPGVVPEPVRWHSMHDSVTVSRTPIIDEVEPGVIAVAGLSGHGFKMAPALARIAVERALDGAAGNEQFTLAGRDYREATAQSGDRS